MKYWTCPSCEFNLSSESEYCLNCGVKFISNTLLSPKKILLKLVKILTKNKLINEENKADRKTFSVTESLRYRENLVNQRISALINREYELESVVKKAEKLSREQWKQTTRNLKTLIQTLKKQHARYEIKSIEIHTARLLSRFIPLVYGIYSYSYNSLGIQLNRIVEGQRRARVLDDRLKQQKSILGDTQEIRHLEETLDQTQVSLRNLYEAFLSRQASLAIQKITPLSDALNNIPSSIVAIRESEIFNIQIAITDFSASLKELELEYIRVHAEEDIAEDINYLLS